MDDAFTKFIQFSKVNPPKVQNKNKNNLKDYDADMPMIDNLEAFAPKISKMMEVIVDDDYKRSKGAYFNGSKMSTLTKRFKQHAAGTDKPPLSHLGIHFIFLPTDNGSTLFDGEKDDRGRLLCRGHADDRGRCLGTISYAMKAYGIRVLTTNPKIKIGVDLDKDAYYKLLGWKQKNKKILEIASEKKPNDKTDNDDLCGDVKSKIDCIHKKFETSLEDCFKTLFKVLGDDTIDQGDDISENDCWKVCMALGGIPATESTLKTVAGIISPSQTKLKCQWKRKIRDLPKAVQNSLNQNGNHFLLERYRGMLDARNNKAALQFFLEIIHRGTLDEEALKAGKIIVKNPEIACNYKRAIMFTSPVVAEDEVKKLFTEPLNQDGLLVRFIAVHLPRAVGLNIKPADVIHKPDVPDNDGTDIQSSARAMRSCPFHKDNLSECIAEQVGGVHRRCYTSNNIVMRRDYQFEGEGGLQRLDEQRKAQFIMRDVMAAYAADCVDHANLHMRKNPSGNLNPDSILASVQVNGKSIPACRQKDRAVKKKYTSYPFLALMEFMPLTKSEFMYILFKHSREKKQSYGKFYEMINTLNASGSVTKLTKMMLHEFGKPLIAEDEGIIGTMLKHPKLKKDISLFVFEKNNINNVSKQFSEILKERKSLELEITNLFNFQIPDVEGWSDVDVIIESFAKMVSVESNATNNKFSLTNANMCIEAAARSPMNINKTEINNTNANNEVAINDLIANKCVYLHTWQFLSQLVIKYYNASLLMIKHKKKPDKKDLFSHIFNFIKGLINVSQRNGVSNKTFIERIPVLSKLTEYIKHLNSQKTHEFENIFQTIQNQAFDDPQKLPTIEVLSSGRMFVISAYLLRSKLGIQNVKSNNTSNNNGLYNFYENNNNNSARGYYTRNQNANSTSSNLNGNLGSAGNLENNTRNNARRQNTTQREPTMNERIREMAKNVAPWVNINNNNNNNTGNNNRNNARRQNTTQREPTMNERIREMAKNVAPWVNNNNNNNNNSEETPNNGDRSSPQRVKRTISAGTARKKRWDMKVKGTKKRKENNAMKRRTIKPNLPVLGGRKRQSSNNRDVKTQKINKENNNNSPINIEPSKPQSTINPTILGRRQRNSSSNDRGTTLRPNRTIRRALRPRKKLLDENGAEELINDFTYHFVRNKKNPLNVMKKIQQLGSEDIKLIRDMMRENSPYNETRNREELNQAVGDEAKHRLKNRITSEKFINSQKDRLRQILSMSLSRFKNDQLKKMFTLPLNELNDVENYNNNDNNDNKNISVATAFKILGLDKKTSTKQDAIKARRKIVLGKDPRYIGHPNLAENSNKKDATEEMQRVLVAFEVVIKYITDRRSKSVLKSKGVQKAINKKGKKKKAFLK